MYRPPITSRHCIIVCIITSCHCSFVYIITSRHCCIITSRHCIILSRHCIIVCIILNDVPNMLRNVYGKTHRWLQLPHKIATGGWTGRVGVGVRAAGVVQVSPLWSAAPFCNCNLSHTSALFGYDWPPGFFHVTPFFVFFFLWNTLSVVQKRKEFKILYIRSKHLNLVVRIYILIDIN